MNVNHIDLERFNPFGATAEELLAYALDAAGLINSETRISDRAAREFLDRFYHKREDYREATKIGGLLIRQGVLTREQLADALRMQKSHPDMKLGEAILALRVCTLVDIEQALETQIRIREDLQDLEECRTHFNAIRERLRKYF